jgi:dTDP-4-amino-4,6-dideoxygalactose transaminase
MTTADALPIRFQYPSMPAAADVERYFERARASGRYSNGGPCYQLLAERLGERVGNGAWAVPVSSGTSALLIALQAMHLDGRTDVLMPSFTFVAVAHAALAAGLTPVFVDIDSAGWHMSAGALARAVEERSDRVAAVVACSAFGTPPAARQRRDWELACDRAGIPLIVDSASGFGAIAEDGLALGAQGDVEVFSLHATKPLAVGEGGVLVTRDSELAGRFGRLANFGFDEHRDVAGAAGLNSKLSEIHAAIGLAALDLFDRTLARRRVAAARIRHSLSAAGYSFQHGAERGAWQFVPCLVPEGGSPRELAEAVSATVETRRYYRPLHMTEHLARFEAAGGELPVTEAIFARILCLPMWPHMVDETADLVSSALGGVALDLAVG